MISATKAGRVSFSISNVESSVSRTPFSTGSAFFNVACRRTRAPAGTGAVKRSRLSP
jgi:hypothetical protein